METKKKTASPQAASHEAKKGPMKTFTAGDVSAAIFAHEHNGRTYYGITFTRWYRDSDGRNRYINSFGLEDLGKVISVAQQSDEYIRALLGDAQ
jgi:hypothetical protein